jgi:hypothetical protein
MAKVVKSDKKDPFDTKEVASKRCEFLVDDWRPSPQVASGDEVISKKRKTTCPNSRFSNYGLTIAQ